MPCSLLFTGESRNELPQGTALRWAHHTPNIKRLPEKVRKRKKTAAEQVQKIIGARFEGDHLPQGKMYFGASAAQVSVENGQKIASLSDFVRGTGSILGESCSQNTAFIGVDDSTRAAEAAENTAQEMPQVLKQEAVMHMSTDPRRKRLYGAMLQLASVRSKAAFVLPGQDQSQPGAAPVCAGPGVGLAAPLPASPYSHRVHFRSRWSDRFCTYGEQACCL